MTLKAYQILALECLSRGPHSVGPLDDEFKIAAVHAFVELQKLGLAISSIEQDGPKYRLTPKGSDTLTAIQPFFREGRLTGMDDMARYLDSIAADRREKGQTELADSFTAAADAMRLGARNFRDGYQDKEPA